VTLHLPASIAASRETRPVLLRPQNVQQLLQCYILSATMASCARITNSGLTADQSLKRTAADNASLSGQQPEPIETIVLLSPSPEAPVCGLPVEHNDLTGSPEARQPPVHHGAANRPYLPRRKHRSKSGSVPAQRQRSNSAASAQQQHRFCWRLTSCTTACSTGTSTWHQLQA